MEALDVNFIELDVDKLVQILNYLGFEKFLKSSSKHKKFKNDVYVTEIKYSDGYDTLIIKPTTISYITGTYPERVHFTAEMYVMLWKIFN
jgi:hypothetical protein